MFIAGIVSSSGNRSTSGKWQLCLNIVVALPPKPPQLDVFSVFSGNFFSSQSSTRYKTVKTSFNPALVAWSVELLIHKKCHLRLVVRIPLGTHLY